MHQRNFFAPAHRALKGVANYSLSPVDSVQTHFGRDFLWGTYAQHTAGANIWTFGAFAANYKINICWAFASQWARNTRIQLDRAQVNVMVHYKSQRQQHAALQDARLDRRVTDRTQQDGVITAKFFDHRTWQ